MSTIEIGAIIIAALIAIAGVAYFTVYDKPKTPYFGEQLTIQIGRAASNATASYSPDNFTVGQGEHVTLAVQNTDNTTHGLAVPKFNIDTGGVQPNATKTISFVPNVIGNYTFDEPPADCGGGSCDSGQSLTGWFLVVSNTNST